ncbi:hypothetical protein BDV18DRAFT_160565 [Aspergillus unguis]
MCFCTLAFLNKFAKTKHAQAQARRDSRPSQSQSQSQSQSPAQPVMAQPNKPEQMAVPAPAASPVPSPAPAYSRPGGPNADQYFPGSHGGRPIPHSLYVYAPNKGAPIFFTAAFALSAAGHLWQCFRYKSWRMIGLHPLVAVLFTAGYALREYGAYNYIYIDNHSTLMIYIMSQVFINVCPPLLELSNYHVLGRIFSYVPHLAPIPPGNVLNIFGGLMGLVEALNGLGVSFTSNPTGNNQGIGRILILISLSIQVCVITVFLIVGVIFYLRCAKASITRRGIPTLLITLYTSMLLILVRCIYRLVEHAGNTSLDVSNVESMESLDPLLRYEWFFYVFDASLMLCNSWLWNIVHPGRYLPTDKRVHLAEDGVTEMGGKGDGELGLGEMLRLGMQVITFGVWGLFTGEEKKDDSDEDTEDRV